MFKPLMQWVIQHLMAQNAWAAPQLKPFAHRTLAIDFKVATLSLCVLSDGALALAPDSATADATLHLTPSLVLRLMRQDPIAMQLIKVDGDSAFATEIGKLLASMRWDVEADLSHLIGDVAAYQVVQMSQQSFQQWTQRGKQLTDMLVEYWQEEQPLLAKKTKIAQFNGAVDQLRDDIARLEARLQAFTQASRATTTAQES